MNSEKETNTFDENSCLYEESEVKKTNDQPSSTENEEKAERINKSDKYQIDECKRERPLTLLHSLLLVFITLTPVLNMIFLFIWSFGKRVNKSKQNISRAILIITFVTVVLYLLMGGELFPVIAGE